jgi:hypothetical protein
MPPQKTSRLIKAADYSAPGGVQFPERPPPPHAAMLVYMRLLLDRACSIGHAVESLCRIDDRNAMSVWIQHLYVLNRQSYSTADWGPFVRDSLYLWLLEQDLDHEPWAETAATAATDALPSTTPTP